MLTGIEIKNINHLGIVAGIIDELEIVKLINQELGIDEQEIVNSGEMEIFLYLLKQPVAIKVIKRLLDK